MASQWISITGQTPKSTELKAYIRNLQMVQNESRRLMSVVTQITAGGDIGALAAALALNDANATTVQALLTAANQRLNHADIDNLLSRLG